MISKYLYRLFLQNVSILVFSGVCSIFSFTFSLFADLQHNLILSDRSQNLLNEIIENYFTDYTANEIKIDILIGGHSTNGVKNLLIIARQKKYVLRMKAEEPSKQWLECELYAMQEAAKIRISPLIYYVSKDHRAILIEYIEAGTLTVAEANQSKNCIAIAQAVSKAHTINKNPYFGSSEDENIANIYLEICNHPKISIQVKEAFEIIEDCKEKLKAFDVHLVNNHGDLNSRNIFISLSGPIFIDWEYANWADRFEDLCYFSLRHNYERKMELLFLESYLGYTPSSEELEKYYLIKKKTFAQLCIYFHYFSLKFQHDRSQLVEKSPSQEWSELMNSYSERNDEISLVQLYFTLANCALKQAKELL